MTRYAILSAALLLAVPAAAQDAAQSPDPAPSGEPPAKVIDSKSAPEQFDLARKKVVDCAGEKFVFAWGAGARPTKVTLCSKEGATPDEVVKMLDDAATRLEGAEGISEDRRAAIVQQIRGKIAEIKGSSESASKPAAAAGAAPAAILRPAVPTPVPSVQPTVAPLPSRPVAPAAARPVLAAKPRLAFECYTPGDLGSGGPCTILGRDTRLTVKAREAVAGGISLRFVRYGETRAEVALDRMRKGQTARIVLPRAICSGAVEAEAKIDVVNGGQVVDSIGPFLLRC